MLITLCSRRRGNVLAFVLMGIIALLAIGLVLFSRARREGAAGPAPSAEIQTESAASPAAADDATTVADDQTTAPDDGAGEAEAPTLVQTPPPPPPVFTPDTRDLPPEA